MILLIKNLEHLCFNLDFPSSASLLSAKCYSVVIKDILDKGFDPKGKLLTAIPDYSSYGFGHTADRSKGVPMFVTMLTQEFNKKTLSVFYHLFDKNVVGLSTSVVFNNPLSKAQRGLVRFIERTDTLKQVSFMLTDANENIQSVEFRHFTKSRRQELTQALLSGSIAEVIAMQTTSDHIAVSKNPVYDFDF